MTNPDTILILMSNYKTLARQILTALERNSGMSPDDVRDLAVASYTVSQNISALADDETKFHWLDPRPNCIGPICGGRYAKVLTEHIEFVTCGKCKRSKLFKNTMNMLRCKDCKHFVRRPIGDECQSHAPVASIAVPGTTYYPSAERENPKCYWFRQIEIEG